jgi:hypothetical protein
MSERQHEQPALVPIAEAITKYHGVSVQMARTWCRTGKLPYVRAGKNNLIDPRDLAALLAPKLRAVGPKPERESPSERERRQLRSAGIAV